MIASAMDGTNRQICPAAEVKHLERGGEKKMKKKKYHENCAPTSAVGPAFRMKKKPTFHYKNGNGKAEATARGGQQSQLVPKISNDSHTKWLLVGKTF